ncbi:hypothetical protein cand_000360 [Cryptosporidium andersoni]|uniref:Uncharacterized protein n=1 Tax=Cryptosporidium andersoni TaxID=117008 RepID=A0A1J4MSV7_9CRYT|nr:hypothetical protein cand_000360 [Cryptosporidium andersoni]
MLILIFQTVGCDIKLKLRENFHPQDSYVCEVNLFYFYLLEKLLNNEVKARYILQDINFNIPEYWSTIVEFCISEGFDICLLSLSLVTFSHASCNKNQHKLFLKRYFYCNKKRGIVHSDLQEAISKYCSFILYSAQDVFKECKAKLSECDLNAISEYTSIIQCLIIDIIGSNGEKECKVVNRKISSTLLNILLILLSTVIEGANFYKLQKILTALLNLVVKVYHMMDNIHSSYGILIDNNSILHKITLLLSYKYVSMLSKETISGIGHILAYFLYTLYYFEISSTITNSIDISSGTNREDITNILSKYLDSTSNIGLMATYRGFVILLSRLGTSDQLYKSTFEAAFYLFIKFITTDESCETNLEKIYSLQSLLVLLSSIRSTAHKSKKSIDVLFFTKNHMKSLVKTIFYIWDHPNNYYTAQVCLIWDELVKLLAILNDLPTIHWLVYLVLNYYWLDTKYQFYSLQSIFSCLITNKDFVEELTSSNIKDEFYNFLVKPFLNIYESELNSRFENQFLFKLLFSLSVNHLFSSALRLLKTWIKMCLKVISNKKDEYKVFTNILKVSFNMYYETRYDKVGDLDYLSYRNKISNFIFSIMQEKYITCDHVDLYKLLSRYITKDKTKRCKLDAIQIMLLLHAQRCDKVAWEDELDKSTQFSHHLYSNIVLFNENKTVEISYKQLIRTLVSSETNNIIKLIDFLVQKFKFYCTSKKSWKLIEVNNIYLIRELEYLYLLIYLGRITNTEEFRYLLNSLYKVFNLIKKLLLDSVNWEVKIALNHWLYKLYRYLVSSIGLYMPYDRYTGSLSILKIYLSSVDFGISCSTSLIDNNKWISDQYSINLTLYYKLLSLTTITSLNSKKFVYELLLNYQFYFGDSIYIAETQLIDKNEYYLKRTQILRKMLYSRRPKDYRACCIYICCLIKRSKSRDVLDNLANVLDIPMNFEDMRGKSIYLQLINVLFNSLKEKVDILNSNNIFEEFNSVKFNGLIALLGTLTDLFKIEIFKKDKYFDCGIDEYCIVLGLIKQCLVLLINMTKVISTIRRYNGMESFLEEQEIRVKDTEVDTWKTFEECCNTVRTFLQNYSLEQLFYNSRCIYSPSNSSIHDYILYIDFLDLLGISYINIILQCNHTGMVDRACEILLIICNSLTNKKLLNKKSDIIETKLAFIETHEEEYVESYNNEIYFTSEITIELSNVCNLPLSWLFDIIDRIFYADYKRAREFKTITFDSDLINSSYSEYLNGCTFHKVSVDNQYTKSTWERCTKREGYIGQDKVGIPKLHREQISEIPSPVRKSGPLCKIIGILFSSLMVDPSNIPILSILIKIFLLGNEFSTLQVTPNKQDHSNLISINMKFTPIYCNHIIASLLLDSNLNKISSSELFDANLICGILLTTGKYIDDNNVNTKEGKWLECNAAVNLLSSLIKKIGKGNKADKYLLNNDSNKRNDYLKFCEFYSCNKSKHQCGLDTANCFSYSLSYLNRSFKGLEVFLENTLKNSRNLYFIGMILIFLSEVSIIWNDCSVSLIITIMSLINNRSYYIRLYVSRLLTNIIFNSSNRNEYFDIDDIPKSKVIKQQHIGTIMNYIHLENWLYELFEILVNTSKLCLNILITKIRQIVCLIEDHLSNSSKLNYNLIHGMLLLCIEIVRRPGVSCSHKETTNEQSEVISEANIALQVICNKILGRYFCSSLSYKMIKTVLVELCDLLIHIIFDIYGDACTNILAVDSIIISLNSALTPNIQNNIFDVICSRVYLVHLLEVNKYDKLLNKLQADFKTNPKCLHPNVISELYRTLYKYTKSGIYHPINNNRNFSSEFANFLLSLIEFHMQKLTLFDLSPLQTNMEVKILKYYTDFLIYIIKLLNNVQSYLSDLITYWNFSNREKYYYILYYIVVGVTKLCDINYNTKYHTPSYFGILNINSKLLMNYLLFIVKHYGIIKEIFRKRDESYIVLFWYEDILIGKFLTLLYSNNVSCRDLITSILYSSKSRYILCTIIGEMLNIHKSETNKLVVEAENNQSTFNKLAINLVFLLMDEILEVRLKSLEIARGYFEVESYSLNNFSFDNTFLCIEELCSKRFTINLLLELMDALFNRIFYISDLGYSHVTKSDIFPFEIDNISNEYIYVSETVSREIVHNIENSTSIYNIMGQLKKYISRWINDIRSDTKIAAIIECININKNCKELMIFEIFGTVLLQDTDIYLFMLNLSRMRVIKAYFDALDNNIQDHSEIMEYTVTQIIEIIHNLEFVLSPMYIK